MNFKDIYIGSLLEKRVEECNLDILHLCKLFKCSEKEIDEMFKSKTLTCDLLLSWCKILEYDFFRLYSQHIILYSPIDSHRFDRVGNEKLALPQFRKSIYTKEIIKFILEQIDSGIMTKAQVIESYRIPKTTLYKWIDKYTS